LELCFLIAYRMGWPVSIAGLMTNVAVGLILLPIGISLYREQLSPVNTLGIALCIIGIILINYKITKQAARVKPYTGGKKVHRPRNSHEPGKALRIHVTPVSSF
jgi:hypothetical protein